MTDPKFPEMDVPVNGELSLRGRIALYLLQGLGPLLEAKGKADKAKCVASAFQLADEVIRMDRPDSTEQE